MSETHNWYDIHDFGIEGQGWTDTKMPYDRLPARAEGIVREPVWNLSRHSTGMSVRFATDATEIRARWKLGGPTTPYTKFAATAASGLDLYGRDDYGRWRWAGAAYEVLDQEPEGVLLSGIESKHRAYTLYLPIFNSLHKAEIGLPGGASFEPVAPRRERPIVYYGTSIVHGAFVSRAGIIHSSILGRRLDMPMINLGFAGNAQMEPEVADLLAELDPAVYVLDTLPNMNVEQIEERAESFVVKLREAHADTPIVLIEDRTQTNTWLKPDLRMRHDSNRAAFRGVYGKLRKSNVGRLSYVEGEYLFGCDGEASMDASHPSDLGAMRMADMLEPVLRKALA